MCPGEPVTRDTVIVIGAGASLGARPDGPRPPLGSGLAQYLLDWYDANAPREDDPLRSVLMTTPLDSETPSKWLYRKDPDVRPILAEAASRVDVKLTGFEAMMSELLAGQETRLLGKINQVICYALLTGKACAFARREDLYDRLFAALRSTIRAVVTPNYDLLAEEALERAGLNYSYRAVVEPIAAPPDVIIDKFHGSTNFMFTHGAGRGPTVAIAQANTTTTEAVKQGSILSIYNAIPIHACAGSRRRDNAVFFLKQQHSEPVLVTYGPGKDSTHGRPFLDRVRSECAADLREHPPGRVIAVGISPPRGDGDDDAWEGLCRQLGSLDCSKEYWSALPDERQRMRELGFDVRDGYFEQLVRALEGY